VTVDGVWIGSWIYWILILVTTNNYDCLTKLHDPKITITRVHIKSSEVFTSRCLVAASNRGRSPSYELTNCPRPKFLASHFLQLPTNSVTTEVKIKVILRPTVSRPVSPGVKPLSGSQDQIFVTLTVMGLLMWGTLSDKRTGVSVIIVSGPCQHNCFWVQIDGDSLPYFTVSDSILPQPGVPGPHIYIPQEWGVPVILQALGDPDNN
jgi:hypothetical protein